MTATNRLNAFMRAASIEMRDDDSEIAQEVSAALDAEKKGPPLLQPAMTPASAVLKSMLSSADGELVGKLVACASDLHWRMAGFGKLSEDFDQKLAVAELIGPDGLFANPDVRIGLLIQREGFHYPAHSHAAEELYFILKGSAMWAVNNAEPTLHGPGSFIRHKSCQPHSIQTLKEPLCALWGWVGDIGGGSYSL